MKRCAVGPQELALASLQLSPEEGSSVVGECQGGDVRPGSIWFITQVSVLTSVTAAQKMIPVLIGYSPLPCRVALKNLGCKWMVSIDGSV